MTFPARGTFRNSGAFETPLRLVPLGSGEHGEAERLAREAVSIGARNDTMLVAAGDAYADLGEVLSAAGNTDEAVEAFERALTLYERKGNLVSADTVRRRLDELGRDPSSV